MPQSGSHSVYVQIARRALPGVVMLALLAGGCDQGETVAKVRKASNSVTGVAGGAEAAINVDTQQKAFKEALDSLSGTKAEGGIGTAISIITASTQMGLLGKNGDEAQSALSELSAIEADLHGLVSHYRTVSAIAEASKLDITQIRAELDRDLEKADKDIAAQRDRLAGVEKSQASLNEQAKGKRAQAAEFERQSVTLKEQTRTMKASESTAILAQALEAKRQCDELRLASANLEAEAGQLEPKKLEAKLAIQESELKRAALAAEKAMLAKRAEASGKGEQEARALVAETVKSIESQVAKVNELRESRLRPAFEAIGSGVSKAMGSLGSAKSEAGGKVIAARAHQRKGDLAQARFRELSSYADVMGSLATATPALPQAAKYAETAKAAKDEAKAAHEEMKQAYTDAKNGFESIQVKGDAQVAARDALVKGLAELAGLPAEGAEPAPEETPSETPAKPDAEMPADDAKPAEGETPAEGEKKPEPTDGK